MSSSRSESVSAGASAGETSIAALCVDFEEKASIDIDNAAQTMAGVPSTPDGRWMQSKPQTIHKRSRAAEKALSSPSEFMRQIERVSEEKGHSTPRKCPNSVSSSLSSASSTGTGVILGSEHFGDVS